MRDAESPGNLLVREAIHHELDNFGLAIGQLGEQPPNAPALRPKQSQQHLPELWPQVRLSTAPRKRVNEFYAAASSAASHLASTLSNDSRVQLKG